MLGKLCRLTVVYAGDVFVKTSLGASGHKMGDLVLRIGARIFYVQSRISTVVVVSQQDSGSSHRWLSGFCRFEDPKSA